MNGKFEEKLAQLAFGDLNAEEARKIEAKAQGDPVARERLATYRSMCQGLRDLSSIPDDQMSNERLRQAILADGLNPAPAKGNGWGWLWMPAATAVLAAAVVMMRPHPVSQVAIGEMPVKSAPVTLTPPAGLAQHMKDEMGSPDMTASVISNSNFTMGIEPARDAETSHSPTHSRRSRGFRVASRDGEGRIGMFTAMAMNLPASPQPNPAKATDFASANPSKPAAQPDNSEPSGTPIVMIEDSKDSNTGARRATEVGASNVLVGG